ncbi:MAG: 4Fe-4S dicluster domain-containing protein [candidate division WOR-3 bacterium]|nr:MAG: 4Fe-4S dicluster domain-containing protein [candidate division WOR-3 bacterium]
MTEVSTLHSVKIDKKTCIGCVTCMKACPTKAIRVRNRKAQINYERCIDCGECLRVCPYNAVVPITTSPADLGRFKYKIGLPSPVLYSQFGDNIMPHEILTVLKELGFDHVYDEALVCEMTGLAIEEYLDKNKGLRPIISSTCPVVVRLIQRLFPSICKLIVPIEPPREIAAKNLREEISKEKNISKEEIGIIHITPCAAKMVSINHPETMKRSFLDGAIAIREIYNAIMMRLQKASQPLWLHAQSPISGIGIGWAIPGGETRGMKFYNYISVSGVYDTIRILEDVESGKLKAIEYLECFICPDGCVGGPLTVENRFIAKSNILRLIRVFGDKQRVSSSLVKRLYNEKFFSFEHAVAPKPFAPLDKNRAEAIKKLKLREKILKKLPGTNCGVCGAPDCITFAEDIVLGKAILQDCIYVSTKRHNRKERHGEEKN